MFALLDVGKIVQCLFDMEAAVANITMSIK